MRVREKAQKVLLCAVYSVHLCKITENFRNKQTVDEKDLIETLTTIGIFAISVAIGLFNEARKKRKRASMSVSASIPGRQEAAESVAQTRVKKPGAENSLRHAQKPQPRSYSFTAAEEGGSALASDDRTPRAADTAVKTAAGDSRPNEMLRTLILGEILANPKFRQ